jgi:hypothetical protein
LNDNLLPEVEETYVPFALVVVKRHAGVTTGIQLYAEGFQPSAYRDMPSAYSTLTAALGVARWHRPPSAEPG